MKLWKLAFVQAALLLVASLTACDKLQLAQKDNPGLKITVSSDKTAIVGRVLDQKNGRKPMPNTVVRLGRVFWNDDHTKGAFVFEGATSPSFITDDKGYFIFQDLDVVEYVVAIGDLIGKNVVISNPDGKPKIYTPKAGKVLDTGNLEVDLSQ